MPVVHTCSVTGCYGSSMINPGLTFFRFPTGDKLRYLKWVDVSQNRLLMAHRGKFIYAHTCASHFDASQFRTPLQDKLIQTHQLIEVSLLWVLVWLICRKSYHPKELQRLAENEKEERIPNWTPKPLVDDVVQSHHPALRPHIVSSKAGKFIEVDGHSCLNMATHNYLGLQGNDDIEASAIKTLKKYGVGSCGPRGFYGTVDVHLDLEEKLAKFMKMEEAVVYSYGFSTIASAIPAYAKRGDILFVDCKVNFAIQKGLDASRSRIHYFKHNDMDDLEILLKQQAELDRKNPSKAQITRRFLIVEGIYMNSGKICPLPQLIQLKKKYKLRIFIDENISFGTLGKHGRGVSEYFNIPVDEIDLIVSSMEWALATIGGFCVGSSFIVEHQRLSGLGYCFSASLPPLLVSAGTTALSLMEKDPYMFETLQTQCRYVQKAFSSLDEFHLEGDEVSPVKHLYLKNHYNNSEEELILLNKIVDNCIENGLALVTSAYLNDVEKFVPRESIRLTVNKMLTASEIDSAVIVLHNAYEKCLDIQNMNVQMMIEKSF